MGKKQDPEHEQDMRMAFSYLTYLNEHMDALREHGAKADPETVGSYIWWATYALADHLGEKHTVYGFKNPEGDYDQPPCPTCAAES